MISKENSLEKQVQSLALIGPFMLLVTLITLLISPSHQQLHLPLIAVSGILICWKWKMQGLFSSLALLTIALFYQLFFNSPPERIFWELLVAAAIALTFSITALSFKEVEEVLCEAQQESTSTKHQFHNLNDQIQKLEEQCNSELNHVNQDTAKSELLRKKLDEQIALTQASEQVAEKIREKMNGISLQNESLLRELFQKRHECDKLSHSLAEQIELTQMELDDQKKAYETLHEAKKTLELKHQNEIEALKETISFNKTSQSSLEANLNLIEALREEKKVTAERHYKEIEDLHEMISSLKESQVDLEKEKNSLNTLKQENKTAEDIHNKEIKTLQETISSLKASLCGQEDYANLIETLKEEKKATEERHQKDIETLQGTIFSLKTSDNGHEAHKKALDIFKEEKKSTEELHFKEIEALHETISSLKAFKTELEKQNGSLKSLKEEKKATEKRHLKDIEALQKQISMLKTSARPEKNSPSSSRSSTEQTQDQSKPNQKLKGKGSKTNNWANTILSRWSEPEDQPQ
ncbi:MAG: hypothetical protein H0W50_06010 [Parachlamydiaceae bacterium]|nr:hypothetical protein [Parachlamydiaceae bacterium]